MMKIGNCGWSYYTPPKGWEKRFKSKLQAYASQFDLVEINSTFYRIPKLSTVRKWREEADEVNKNFEFTIKCSQLITHIRPFQEQAFQAYLQMMEIAKILRSKILLFQSPSSFGPTKKNIELASNFFSTIDRDGLILVWEVRWAKQWTEPLVKELFAKLGINQCVDPLRQNCFYHKDVLYYRLHGFGRPSMYNYSFSNDELTSLAKVIKKAKKPVYVLFNNADCYRNAVELRSLLSRSSRYSV